jgi:excisionase family DNA binding protein
MLSSTHAMPTFSGNHPEKKRDHSFDENELLTVKEVAVFLRVPVSWVYERTRKRSLDRLPGIRLGKYWRFRQGEVLAWVENQRQHSHAT